MLETFKHQVSRAVTAACRRLLSVWVRTRVLPQDVAQLELGNARVYYVLEMRSFSNYLVLEQQTLDSALPNPAQDPHGVLAMRRRHGWIKRRESPGRHFEQLDAMLEQAAAGEEIKLVPVSVFWGRRPDKEHSLFKALFSDSWALVGPVAKFFMIVLHGRQVLVNFATPVDLRRFVAENEADQKRVRKLSRVLRVHFRRQRTSTIGPDLSHRRTLVNSLLDARPVREAIAKEAAKKNNSPEAARRMARRYALEIAGDYSYPVIRALDHMLSWLWNRLYDGVEVNHFDTVREVAPGNELVYVPCHRSHMDYLLLSYVLYHQGLMPPHVAAGINLNIPVIGGILRRAGAFYIRRSFRGNQLYTAVIGEYLSLNFAKGVSIEYFTEGGRSRTGRTLKPRLGMLTMSARSYLRNSKRPIVFVPVYIGYEKVIEAPSYVSELAGRAQKGESFFGFFKSLRALWQVWGRVSLNVGEPIFLDQLFDRHEPDWRQESDHNVKPAWLSKAVAELGQTIHTHINQAAAVNPVSLVALALLSTPKHALDENELIRMLDLQRTMILALPDHPRVTVTELSPEAMIRYAEKMRAIERQPHALGDVLYLDAKNSVLLNYYRNNCLHLLALPALIACCFQQQGMLERQRLVALATRIYPFLRNELFLPWDEEALPESLEALLDFMRDEGLLSFNSDAILAPAVNTPEFTLLNATASALLKLLQRFYLCITLLTQRDSGSLSQSELEELCALTAQRLSLLHEFQGPEVFSKAPYRQTIALLKRSELVTTKEDKLHFDASLAAFSQDAELVLSQSIRTNIRAARSVGSDGGGGAG